MDKIYEDIKERATNHELEFLETNKDWAYANAEIRVRLVDEKDAQNRTLLDFMSNVLYESYVSGAVEQLESDRETVHSFLNKLIWWNACYVRDHCDDYENYETTFKEFYRGLCKELNM